MKPVLVLGLLAVACGGGAPATRAPAAPALTPAQQKLAGQLDAAAKRALAGKPMVGVSVAVVHDA